jgi:hypothetical protein
MYNKYVFIYISGAKKFASFFDMFIGLKKLFKKVF